MSDKVKEVISELPPLWVPMARSFYAFVLAAATAYMNTTGVDYLSILSMFGLGQEGSQLNGWENGLSILFAFWAYIERKNPQRKLVLLPSLEALSWVTPKPQQQESPP